MEEISSSIKCGNCKNVLDTPVLLPCGDSICKKHTVESKESILCHTCGVEHAIPANVSFPLNKSLVILIKAQIADIDFGNEHKEAKQACENFDDLLRKIDVFLKDPYNFTYETIVQLKNVVQLKGEEEIVRIKENMHRIIDNLDEYKNECKIRLAQSRYLKKLEKLTMEKEEARKEMEKWLAKLNELKVDSREYERIKFESEKTILRFENKLMIDFIPKRFEEFRNEIEKDFGKFEIDSPFDLWPRNVLESLIIPNSSMRYDLFKLCGFESIQKCNLLYRGSLHGFKANDFHSKCDNIPKTLTVIKSTSGNVFGGYTEAMWDKSIQQTKMDENAFIFSLINKTNSPIKVKISNGTKPAITCNSIYGPIFGSNLFGNDICIANDANDAKNFSNFGSSYCHPNYPAGSYKAQCFLAGSYYFTVEEIEVFQVLQSY